MTYEKNLSDELLKRNGTQRGQLSDSTREDLRKLITRDKVLVRRSKWAMIISWTIIVAWLGGGRLLAALWGKDPSGMNFPGIVLVLAMAMPYIAIVCTVSYFIRSRSLTSRQIQARLANIEEQLLRIVESQEEKSRD